MRIWIRIQHFRLNTDSDPDQIRIQGFSDQKKKKITAEKVFLFIKNYNFPFLDLQRTSKLQKKPSAVKREHRAFQNMKFLNFFLLVSDFALLDPDPDSENGSTDLIESGSNTDPDL